MAKKQSAKKSVEEPVDDKPKFFAVTVKNGDSLISLPNRMIVVEEGRAIVSQNEYLQLKKMGCVD